MCDRLNIIQNIFLCLHIIYFISTYTIFSLVHICDIIKNCANNFKCILKDMLPCHKS